MVADNTVGLPIGIGALVGYASSTKTQWYRVSLPAVEREREGGGVGPRCPAPKRRRSLRGDGVTGRAGSVAPAPNPRYRAQRSQRSEIAVGDEERAQPERNRSARGSRPTDLSHPPPHSGSRASLLSPCRSACTSGHIVPPLLPSLPSLPSLSPSSPLLSSSPDYPFPLVNPTNLSRSNSHLATRPTGPSGQCGRFCTA